MPTHGRTILALDPALTTGWAHTHAPIGGTWKNPGVDVGERFAFFGGWLHDLLAAYPACVIAYERAHFQGGDATRLALGWETLIRLRAHEIGATTMPCHTATLKKHATGNGRADKAAMMAAARERNPTFEIVDDNHCDALWLLDWALSN